MALKYRNDENLVFLKYCENEDLEVLVQYLTETKKGDKRINQELTFQERYVEHHPDHKKYWDLIAAELQSYGSNSVAKVFRGGKGVYYKEILIDVSKKLKVNFNKDSSVEIIEKNLLMKILLDAVEKMDKQELKEVVKDLNLKTMNLEKQAVVAALQMAIKAGGFKSYQLAIIVANAVAKQLLGRGLVIGGNAALARGVGVFAGPIGWVLVGLWTAVDIAGPAYRVTMPAVIQIAYMRSVFSEE